MGSLLAVNHGFTVTKETAVIFAAVIAGVASLIGAITAGILSFLNEKSRQRHTDVETRHGLLREHATRFTTTTVELAERARAVTRIRRPARLSLRRALKRRRQDAILALLTVNGDLRIQFQTLLLISESTNVHETARLVVRAAWNERRQAMGEPRNHPRLLGPNAAVIKEMRAHLRPFQEAVRKELGVNGKLAADLED